VYHKRRISWDKFQIQVNKFGKARPILNAWYPEHAKITFWFPGLFSIGFGISFLLMLLSWPYFMVLYAGYFFLLFLVSWIQNKNSTIAYYSVYAAVIQFYGYGTGFLKSYYKIFILRQKPEIAFPELFFKK
jgi:hypothetical protein